MGNEGTTLYKLMILYMLSKVNFPISNTQFQNFLLNKQYTNYFVFQETISALVEDGFINEHNYTNSTQYTLADYGKETIGYFNNKIPSAIREDIENFLAENRYELKSENLTTADIFEMPNGEFMVHCQVKEKDTTIIELNLNVPLREMAELMCFKWNGANQEIYDYVMHRLM